MLQYMRNNLVLVKFCFPFVTIASALILDIVSRDPLSKFELSLVILSFYYWMLYRPDLLTIPSIFCLGILKDVFDGAILGYNPFIFITLYFCAATQRKYFIDKPFYILWLGLIGFSMIAFSMKYILLIVLRGGIALDNIALQNWILNFSLYPLFVRIMIPLHKAVRLDV